MSALNVKAINDYEKKLFAFIDGKYLTKAPTVSSAQWSTKEWIEWIDREGVWLFEECDIGGNGNCRD